MAYIRNSNILHSCQASRFDHETHAYQPVHTPHLVFLTLKIQKYLHGAAATEKYLLLVVVKDIVV